MKEMYDAEMPHRPKRWGGGSSTMAGIMCPPWSEWGY